MAVVPLGGAIRVCHHCDPGRHVWWQVRPSHYLLVHQCSAVGSAVRCSAGGWEWGAGCGVSPARAGAGVHPSAFGGEAGEPRGPSLGRGPGPWAPGGRRVVSGGAALGGPP